MFFNLHGQTEYTINGESFQLTNIAKCSINIKKNESSLQSVNVNYRTPEELAFDVYNNAKLYWVILQVNNIVNPAEDWLLTDEMLQLKCERIYKDNIYGTKYFKDVRDNSVFTDDDHARMQKLFESDSLPEYVERVTFYDYEKLVNESKKVVKIIPKDSVSKYVEDFKSILKGK